jgi:hypothetical protein
VRYIAKILISSWIHKLELNMRKSNDDCKLKFTDVIWTMIRAFSEDMKVKTVNIHSPFWDKAISKSVDTVVLVYS